MRRSSLPVAEPTLVDAIAGRARPMVLVDLAPEITLPAAPALRGRGLVVVPALQRWCAVPAGRRLREMLVAAAPAEPTAARRGVVFLLDGARGYWYPECRFPPPRLLHAEGVDEVIFLPRIAPDLEAYAATLAGAGIRARAA